jgi:hypothetical protein
MPFLHVGGDKGGVEMNLPEAQNVALRFINLSKKN